MILGIGSDIVDIRRIEKSLADFGKRFEEKIFTPEEIATAGKRGKSGMKAKASSLAKRFAAKEACAKALGVGIGKKVSWQDMAVINHANGLPEIILTGNAQKHLDKLSPRGMNAQINLSLSDEYPLALAFVIISAIPG